MANYRVLFYVVTSRYRTYGFSNFPSRLTNCITDSLSFTGMLSDALPVSLSSVTIASTILKKGRPLHNLIIVYLGFAWSETGKYSEF